MIYTLREYWSNFDLVHFLNPLRRFKLLWRLALWSFVITVAIMLVTVLVAVGSLAHFNF